MAEVDTTLILSQMIVTSLVLLTKKSIPSRDADTIVVLERGRIVQRGDHCQLLREDGPYRRLYQLQFADNEVKGFREEPERPAF